MSKLETPLTVRYWKEVGGTLIEEFPAVPPSAASGPRRIDGIIIRGGETKRIPAGERKISLKNKDVIVVQAKRARLGMPLLGQAILSAALVSKHYEPRSLRSVAVYTKDDAELRSLLYLFPHIEIVVYPDMHPTQKALQTNAMRRAIAGSDL